VYCSRGLKSSLIRLAQHHDQVSYLSILMNRLYPLPRWRPQLGTEPMNISINTKLSVEREPLIGQTLIDMRGRKPAREGYMNILLYTL
jgi:hypothetical protein